MSLLLSLFVAVVKNKSITTADGDRGTYTKMSEEKEVGRVSTMTPKRGQNVSFEQMFRIFAI